LEEMKSIRQKGDSLQKFDFLQDLPGTVEDLFPPTDPTTRHFGLVALALVLIGNGYTDECHNLITPLSWPDDIHFAYGPSVYSNVSAEARSYATYVHCLVHRKEAFNMGEFGMMGFANANYWSSAVKTSPGVDLLPHAELLERVQTLASSQQYADSASVQDWCRDHGILLESSVEKPYFETRAVHELCATVLRQKGSDEKLKAFAEQVAESEIRILLSHALEKAGLGEGVDKASIEAPSEGVEGDSSL
jgi:hypothetical protein